METNYLESEQFMSFIRDKELQIIGKGSIGRTSYIECGDNTGVELFMLSYLDGLYTIQIYEPNIRGLTISTVWIDTTESALINKLRTVVLPIIENYRILRLLPIDIASKWLAEVDRHFDPVKFMAKPIYTIHSVNIDQIQLKYGLKEIYREEYDKYGVRARNPYIVFMTDDNYEVRITEGRKGIFFISVWYPKKENLDKVDTSRNMLDYPYYTIPFDELDTYMSKALDVISRDRAFKNLTIEQLCEKLLNVKSKENQITI